MAFVPHLIGRLRQQPMLELDELKRRLDAEEDLLVLDVRSAEECHGELRHVRGAVNVPLVELAELLDQLATQRNRAIAILCRTDRRSTAAHTLLREQGFAKVRAVHGGRSGWVDKGWSVG